MPLHFVDIKDSFENSFDSKNRRVFLNQKWRQKVEELLAKIGYIDLYIVNLKCNHFNQNRLNSWAHLNQKRIVEYSQFRKIVSPGRPNTISLSNINIAITNNHGDGFTIFTPWMIIHRCVHAILSHVEICYLYQRIVGYTEKYLSFDFQENNVEMFVNSFVGIRSFRKKLLFNNGEIIIELITKYIICGHIPLDENSQYYSKIKLYVEYIEELISQILAHSKGNFFVF